MAFNEENLLTDFRKTVTQERSIDHEFNIISSQDFESNKFLLCKYNQSQNPNPNIKHRKFAKTVYYI